jgi:hypothetical protein
MASQPANNMRLNEQPAVHKPIICIDFLSRLPFEVSCFHVRIEVMT